MISIFSMVVWMMIPSSSVHAGPCSPRAILGKLLGARDQTGEWLAEHFQYRDVKNFDADLYFKSRDEFENLKMIEQLPQQPEAKEFEKSVAWLDAQTATLDGSKGKLPSLQSVLEKGTENQKVRLSEWVNAYAGRSLTEYQTQQAALDLSLILNNTRYNLSELYRHGAGNLAQKMVKSQYHEALLQKQLMATLQENDLLKKENIVNALNRIRLTSPTKWIVSGGSNAYTISSARRWGHTLLFNLPDHQFARISLLDLETILKTGGVDSPKFAEIAAQYQGKVAFQAFYNSTQTLIGQLSNALWVEYGIQKYEQYQDRKAKLKAKDHS